MYSPSHIQIGFRASQLASSYKCIVWTYNITLKYYIIEQYNQSFLGIFNDLVLKINNCCHYTHLHKKTYTYLVPSSFRYFN